MAAAGANDYVRTGSSGETKDGTGMDALVALFPSAISHTTGGPAPTPRPNAARPDPDFPLSYYQSDLAGKAYVPDVRAPLFAPLASLERTTSTTSSSSAYSDHSSSPQNSELTPDTSPSDRGKQPLRSLELKVDAGEQHRRRPSNQSEGAADNRRIAVVQLDTPSTPSLNSSPSGPPGTPGVAVDTLLERRGLHSRFPALALVAPSDALFDSALHLTPPSSAPVVGTGRAPDIAPSGPRSSPATGHHRSTSEAVPGRGKDGVHKKTSSRDIGIVGTRRAPGFAGAPPMYHDPVQGLKPPIFQTPQSRSPSPHISLDSPVDGLPSSMLPYPHPANGLSSSSLQMPTIGERAIPGLSTVATSASRPNSSSSGQFLHEVSGDPDKSRASTSLLSSSTHRPSSYLYYQPGVHSTAGPLPPPPRAMFQIDVKVPPPPRPPRLRSPSPTRSRNVLNEAAASSVSVILASKSSVASLKHLDSAKTAESSRLPVGDVTNTPG